MNQCLSLVLLFCLCAAPVAVAADLVTYSAVVAKNDGTKQNTTIRFDHAAHADRYTAAVGCSACHPGTPAKIAISRKNAHGEACLDCHKARGGKAPTLCADCHK